MLSYFEANASTQVSIRLCVFSDGQTHQAMKGVPLSRRKDAGRTHVPEHRRRPARRLVDNATAGAFGWAQREGAFEALKARWQPGRCSLVTDVAIGWLGARVFARSRLHAVEVSPNLEYYPWPLYRRFSARHALAVHGLKKAGAHAWFAEQASNASHVPPRLSCRASPWAHQRSASWRLCTSLSACDDPGVPLEPSIGQLRNFSVPWVPGAVRDLCKLHASGRLGRSRSGVRSRGAENFTRRAR